MNVPEVTDEEVNNFIEIQYNQQLKSLYPIVRDTNDSFIWTIGEFPDVDFFANTWTSAVFEEKNLLWYQFIKLIETRQANIEMRSKSKPLQERSLNFELTSKGHNSTTTFTSELLSASSSQANKELRNLQFGNSVNLM